MADGDQEIRAPIALAGGVLDRYRHICAFVNSKDEEHRIFDPFVIEGLASGDTLSFIIDPKGTADWVRHFRQLGLDVPTLLRQGRFELQTWHEAHLHGGRFDQDAMLVLLDELMGRYQSPRMRVVADMGWAIEQQGVRDRLLEYEVRANTIVSKYEHVGICVYDTTKFGADFVIDVLRTHPVALVGGVLRINPFFVPATEYLAEVRSRDQGAQGV